MITSTCISSAGENFFPGQTCGSITACTSAVPIITGCCEPPVEVSGSCQREVTPEGCMLPGSTFHKYKNCNIIPACVARESSAGGVTITTTIVEPTKPAIEFTPEIPLPNFLGGPITGTTFAQYLRAVFIYFIGAICILAVVMVTYGGVKWVAAAGNAARINDAREVINNAIIGLVIALTSWLLLSTIDPRLRQFEGIGIKPISGILLDFYETLQKDVGVTYQCLSQIVSSDPDFVCRDCTGSADCQTKCAKKFNSWINKAARDYKVDPMLMKAIMQAESPKIGITPKPGTKAQFGQYFGAYYSGPTFKNSNGKYASSAHGIVQFTAGTLLLALPRVNGGVMPSVCNKKEAELIGADKGLIRECADWLDANLEKQIRMQAAHIDWLSTKCHAGDSLTQIAGAYKQGQGYCLNPTALSKSAMADAEAYAREVQKNYYDQCHKSKSITEEERPGPSITDPTLKM